MNLEYLFASPSIVLFFSLLLSPCSQRGKFTDINVHFFFSQREKAKVYLPRCCIFSLLSLPATGFGIPSFPLFRWFSFFVAVTLPLRFKAVSAYLGRLYTVPGHVTCSAASGSSIFPRNSWISFPIWNGEWTLQNFLPGTLVSSSDHACKDLSGCKTHVAFVNLS